MPQELDCRGTLGTTEAVTLRAFPVKVWSRSFLGKYDTNQVVRHYTMPVWHCINEFQHLPAKYHSIVDRVSTVDTRRVSPERPSVVPGRSCSGNHLFCWSNFMGDLCLTLQCVGTLTVPNVRSAIDTWQNQVSIGSLTFSIHQEKVRIVYILI